ncbi:MAG: Trehalose utilization [Ferruginibacter sp.]|nr:Trehalose utilization [Ferruginibacter sp.]
MIVMAIALPCRSQQRLSRFRALVLFETTGHHVQYSVKAKGWLNQLAGDSSFSIDYFNNTDPGFADGMVNVEDTTHPCMKNVPRQFIIEKEEWYTYDKSPRPNVKVIASVDESTYAPSTDIKMGDHPVIWTNTSYAARNIYIFMGHSPELFKNKNYTTLVRNAIFWAALKPESE